MKRCFSTLGCCERSLDEILLLAKQYGIPYLEFRGMCGKIDNREISAFSPPEIEKTKAKIRSAGLAVRVVGASASFDDPEKRGEMLSEAHTAVLVASALNAPYIRVFGNSIRGDEKKTVSCVIDGLTQLCRDASEHGVTVLLETHGDFNRSETLSPVLEALGDRPEFGLIWDVMHTYFATGRDFLPLYRTLLPYIRHVHIKDCTADRKLVCLGDGDIPLGEILEQLSADRFGGCVSLEWERKWHPELPSIEVALEDFVRLS